MTAPRPFETPGHPTPVAGRRALVVGLGSFGGGLGAARWLAGEGARVTVTDLRDASTLADSVAALADLDVELVLGEHRQQDFEAADLVVANPAVPPSSPWLARARRHGAEVTSEVALFLERVRADVFAVTGTQGKSSSVSMAQQLLAGAGRRAHAGGNIGGSLLDALSSIHAGDAVVLELSSYQLEALPRRAFPARVRAVAITNVLSDHLERHGNEDAYCNAKTRILELVQRDGTALLPGSDARFTASVSASKLEQRALFHTLEHSYSHCALHVEDGNFRFRDEVLGAVADLRVPGTFQVANALVALGLARLAGVSAQRLSTLVPTLVGLRHRMEDLGFRAGIRVIDNGVSTTPDSTEAVLCDIERGASLLVGGESKRLPLERLIRTAHARALRVFAFGAAREDLRSAFEASTVAVHAHDTLEAAVRAALASTARGGTLLFSPACASFDAFANFRARAEAFRKLLPEADSAAAAAAEECLASTAEQP